MVMLLFERLVEQNIHNREYYQHGVISEATKDKWMERQKRYLIPLIRSHVTKTKDSSVPQYMCELFAHFCASKRDYIDLSCIHEEREFMCNALRRVFFLGKRSDRRLNNDRIKSVFPNLNSYKDEHGFWVKVDHIAVPERPDVSYLDDASAFDDDKGDAQSPEAVYGVTGDIRNHPGEHYKDQFPDRIDPRGDPDEIEFRWNRDCREMEHCDTQHMLYLLQIACDLYRQRVIRRNKYFASISRPDRFLSHIDCPQLITNILEWHNQDRAQNVFTGKQVLSGKEVAIIDDIFCGIGMLTLHS